MQCKICDADYSELPYVTPIDSTLCPQCHYRTYGVYGRSGYAVHGCSDGPGSAVNEIVFDRPDMAKEVRLTLKRMEDDGKLNTPELIRAAQVKYDELKDRPVEKLDYQKEGHPLERTGSN